MSFKTEFFLKFRNIHRKTPVLESLYNKVAGLQACKFTKKRLQQNYFAINIAKFLITAFFVEHLRWLHFKAMFETCQNFTMQNEKGF